MQVSALAVAPEAVVASCVRQLRGLYDTQTAPFVGPFVDYAVGLQRARELEVRLLQLDKEGAELRDENAALHARLGAVDLAAAAHTAAQLDEARAALGRAERDLGILYRDKANLLEEVVGANSSLTSTRSALESTTTQLAQARAEISALRDQLSALGSNLAAERSARVAAAGELVAALGARDGALAEAERLRADNAMLVRRLMEIKEGEAGRLKDLNRMHEELLEQHIRMRQEAELDRQATELIRQRAVAAALSGVAVGATANSPGGAAGGGGGGGGMHGGMGGGGGATSVMVTTAAAAAAGLGTGAGAPLPSTAAAASSPATGASTASGEWVDSGMGLVQGVGGGGGSITVPTSLREVMGLLGGGPPGGGGRMTGLPYESSVVRPPELRMPCRTAVALVATAHKGGCNSLAPQSPGHLVASCGADRAVAVWDVAMLGGPGGPPGPAILLHGMTGAVNDCAFTCDAAQVVAAGSDKSLHVWDATSGRHRHTLTGHAGPVTGLALSALDCRLAVSISEDRSFKLWDLGRGFSLRSIPCAKMPLCLALSRDGNTVVTGHLDGSVLLWDVRQCRAGAAAPLQEVREQSSTQPVVGCVAVPGEDSCLVLAARDGTLRLWDFRGAAQQRLMRHPGFVLGTSGGTGRPRCRLALSPEGRLLAAGGADGSVWVWDLRAAGGAGPAADPKQLRTGPGPSAPPAHRDSVVATAFSTDCSTLMSADKAGGLVFWAME